MNPNTQNEPKTILVIEDEIALLEAIKNKLLKNNFEVLFCRDVESALKIVSETPKIDLIWLDHYLIGQQTGLDFVIKMKHDFPNRSIPIYIVSVSIDSEKSNQYLHLGAEKYFTKSNFGLQEIINDITKYLNK